MSAAPGSWLLRDHDFLRHLLLHMMSIRPRLIMTEHEEPNGRRQVGVQSAGINRADKIGQFGIPGGCDVLQRLPELIFKTDTGLMASDDNRAFYD